MRAPPPRITNLALLVALGVAFASGVGALGGGRPRGRRRGGGAAGPVEVWIDDVAPEVDHATWRLVVADADGERELSLEELSGHDARLRATLDCTSGWYAHQDWEGVPVAALVRNTGAARSLHVHSARRPCSRTASR